MSAGARQLIQFELSGLGQVELNLAADSRTFVFFGSNGVGKTRCLETLYMMHMLTSTEVRKTLQNWIVKPGLIPKISINGKPKFEFSHQSLTDEWWLTQSAIPVGSLQNNGPIVLISAGARANLPISASAQRPLGSFETRQKHHIQVATTAITNNQLRQYSGVEDPRQWFVQRAQSVNAYQKESDRRNADLDALLTALHEMDERIDPNGLVVDGDERVFLTIEGQQRELSELSSGFIALVKMIQSIVAAYSDWTNEADLRQVPGTVFIDEIESHLHPQWQAHIVGQLQTLFPKTRFYIATHSPLVLSRLKDGEAYVLQRDKDGVVRSQAIASPSKRVMADLLKQGFDVDLNSLKREDLLNSDQSQAKQALLELLQGDAPAAPQTPARGRP